MTEEKKSDYEIIKEKLTPQLIKEIFSSASEHIKNYTGIYIGTSFAIIIFLLSLITERTIFLDLGILFYVLSILINFQVTGIPFLLRYYLITNPKKATKIILLIDLFGKMGNNFFIFGLTYTMAHFNLWIIVIIMIVYINLDYVGSLYFLMRRILEMKSKVQLDKARKFYLYQLFPMEIISFTFSLILSTIIYFIN